MERGLRVAIAGASGIGNHHAKWFHHVGAQVVGFLGRSRENVAATERGLLPAVIRKSELIGDDFMSLLIARFAEAAAQPTLMPLISGEIELRNLDYSYKFYRTPKGKRGRGPQRLSLTAVPIADWTYCPIIAGDAEWEFQSII